MRENREAEMMLQERNVRTCQLDSNPEAFRAQAF